MDPLVCVNQLISSILLKGYFEHRTRTGRLFCLSCDIYTYLELACYDKQNGGRDLPYKLESPRCGDSKLAKWK